MLELSYISTISCEKRSLSCFLVAFVFFKTIFSKKCHTTYVLVVMTGLIILRVNFISL